MFRLHADIDTNRVDRAIERYERLKKRWVYEDSLFLSAANPEHQKQLEEAGYPAPAGSY